MHQSESPQPREVLSTPAAVGLLLGGVALIVLPVGLALYFLTTLHRASSSGAAPDGDPPRTAPAGNPAAAPSRPAASAKRGERNQNKRPTNAGLPIPEGKDYDIQIGVLSPDGSFKPQFAIPASSEQVICRIAVRSVTTSDVYSTYWYVDDVPGDRTGRLMCDIHGKPFTEADVQYVQRYGGTWFNHTMTLKGYYIAPGLYRVEVVKSGRKLGFVRFRIE